MSPCLLTAKAAKNAKGAKKFLSQEIAAVFACFAIFANFAVDAAAQAPEKITEVRVHGNHEIRIERQDSMLEVFQ